MKLARSAGVWLLLLWAACARAQGPHESASGLQPEDFAFGLTLFVPATEPFARFDLPVEVISGTAWPDLRDIRVFNSSRETVSFSLIQPPSGEDTRRRVALRPFRLEPSPTGAGTRIELDARERGVELRVGPGTTAQTGTEYLLAVTDEGLTTPIDRLLFDWKTHTSNWQQKVTVSVSSDLDSWRPAAIARPLMDLRTEDGQQLRHAEVIVERMTPQSARYWRLQFEPGFAPALTSVEGEVTTAGADAPGVALGTRVTEETSGAAVYELPSRQPVARVQVTPQGANSVLLIAIEGKDDDDKEWRAIARTVAYRLNQRAGGEQTSAPISLGGRMLKRLRLRPLSASWGNSPPALQVERDPVTIVFNARGAGPFLLAWGSRAAASSAIPVGTLMPGPPVTTLRALPMAREAGRVELGGAARLTEQAPGERRAQWRTTLIWVVLVGGAGALALLAFVVYRESRRSATNQETPRH